MNQPAGWWPGPLPTTTRPKFRLKTAYELDDLDSRDGRPEDAYYAAGGGAAVPNASRDAEDGTSLAYRKIIAKPVQVLGMSEDDGFATLMGQASNLPDAMNQAIQAELSPQQQEAPAVPQPPYPPNGQAGHFVNTMPPGGDRGQWAPQGYPQQQPPQPPPYYPQQAHSYPGQPPASQAPHYPQHQPELHSKAAGTDPSEFIPRFEVAFQYEAGETIHKRYHGVNLGPLSICVWFDTRFTWADRYSPRVSTNPFVLSIQGSDGTWVPYPVTYAGIRHQIGDLEVLVFFLSVDEDAE